MPIRQHDFAKAGKKSSKKALRPLIYRVIGYVLLALLVVAVIVHRLHLYPSEPSRNTALTPKKVATVNPLEKQPLPKKPQAPVAPTFDFYTLLPKNQKVTPEDATKTQKPAKQYFLKILTTQDRLDADRIKTQLELLGFDVLVDQVKNVQQPTLERVLVGPFSTPAQMKKAQKQLLANQITSTVLPVLPAVRIMRVDAISSTP